MIWEIKEWSELSTKEVENIFSLRSEVFIVEQDCVYQDIDGKDQKAKHVLGKKNNEIIAYSRIFKPGDYFDNVSIGRVVVRQDQRKYGLGKKIMLATMAAIDQRFPNKPIEISAQSYLLKFYTDLGFSAFGEEYLEDGIPHRRMLKK